MIVGEYAILPFRIHPIPSCSLPTGAYIITWNFRLVQQGNTRAYVVCVFPRSKTICPTVCM